MREVIARVLAVEAEARGIVAAAQAEAERIRREARQEAQERVEKIRLDAAGEAEGLMAAALRDALHEKESRLAEAAREIEAEVRVDEATRKALLDAIVRCVAGVQ